jgi:hypothetical protein
MFTREAPAVEARKSFRAGNVVEVLRRLGSEKGLPEVIQPLPVALAVRVKKW